MWLCLDGGCGNVNPDSARVCTECGSSAMQVRLAEPGSTIGPYEIRRFIGHGGYGVVYEAARRGEDGRLLDIALKQTSLADYRTLERELNLLRRLSHPNLPVYYEAFQHEGSGYLAMEFVQGQNLRELLNHAGDALGEKQVLQYALELCSAVALLHGQNPPLLHRDIKPANIRLTPQGRIKLVDFGLTKESAEMTRTAQQGATPAYAAWEQVTGTGTDERSDIYSIGATLYHLLTNEYPATSVERGMGGPERLVPPEQLNPDLSKETARIIRKAMERQPEARYQSVAEMERALRRASGKAVTTRRTQSRPVAPALPPVTESARRVAGAATNSLSNALFGVVSGVLSGAVAGVVGGFSGWLFWTLTHWGSLLGLGDALAALDLGATFNLLLSDLSRWVAVSAFGGAILAALFALLMALLGARESPSPFARIVVSFFGAMWAVLTGLFLTATHLVLAAIPFTVLGWFDPEFGRVLLRPEPLPLLIGDLGYWAAVGAIGWAVTLTVDRPRDSDLAVDRFGFLKRLIVSLLTAAFALGGGAYIVWLLLSAAGLRETINPESLLAHLRTDTALHVGVIGGLLLGLLRAGRRASAPSPAPGQAAPAPAVVNSPQQAATRYLPPKK